MSELICSAARPLFPVRFAHRPAGFAGLPGSGVCTYFAIRAIDRLLAGENKEPVSLVLSLTQRKYTVSSSPVYALPSLPQVRIRASTYSCTFFMPTLPYFLGSKTAASCSTSRRPWV